jgi:undecaprenyl-diphosphatase
MTSFNPGNNLCSFFYFLTQWGQRNWLPLLLLFGAYIPLAVFAILAMQIWQLEGGLWWDVAIMHAIHAAAQPQLDTVAAVLTKFGTKWGVIPASMAISLALLYRRRWQVLTFWIMAEGGCIMINRFAKSCLHRIRPSLWEHASVSEFSFPSGHAMASMGFVAALIVLTWNSRWRVWVWLLGGLFVMAIGWTRLYLGVHYPSDIIAGWMMSIAWAVAVSAIVKPLSSVETSAQETEPSLATQISFHSSD